MRECIINLLYPRRCPICEEIIVKKDKICEKCKKEILYLKEPRCKKCSKEMESGEIEYCYDCTNTNHFFNKGIATFKHDNNFKKSIYNFKYKNKREYADFYTEAIIKNYKEMIGSWNAEVLIPIPLFASKKVQRGFNQAEILAYKLSVELKIPVDSKLLQRNRNTNPQKELNRIQRVKNVEKAFNLSNKIVQYRKIILIDDIYTTGATLDSCAKILREAGVKYIYFVTISIGDDLGR